MQGRSVTLLGNRPGTRRQKLPSPFLRRHLGPSSDDQLHMLNVLGFERLEQFLAAVVPGDILDHEAPQTILPSGCSEAEALSELAELASNNVVLRSLIGLGYHGTVTPALIRRHILENPSWYTAYTPYQAEISQGRLEALLNFQTLISELTGLPIANASLLDEATAAAEAMSLSLAVRQHNDSLRYLVDAEVLPQTLAVLKTRAEPLGIQLDVADPREFRFDEDVFGIILQLPCRSGVIRDPRQPIAASHAVGALATVAVDPLAQVLFTPVAKLGADIAIGSAQRFGVPMGFGGPHAAFFATREEYKRQIPGRLVGRSRDVEGRPALRLALQTREQHIRRDKATSNICTAQVLLAVMASFYAVHHGPEGLTAIAKRILHLRGALELALVRLGFNIVSAPRFDTLEFQTSHAGELIQAAALAGFNLRTLPLESSINNCTGVGVSLDELSDEDELLCLLEVFANVLDTKTPMVEAAPSLLKRDYSCLTARNDNWLQQQVFHNYRSETSLLRYIHRLASKDLSLVHGMMPLGSCTMKLNAAAELLPVTWPAFAALHPFAPADQSLGYQRLVKDLEQWLAVLTGFEAVSLQPNAGSQGEYAGLLVIRAWHRSRGEDQRNVCLIPSSAHGTNPASAVMAGLQVVSVACDNQGNVDLVDLASKASSYAERLAALMVTYPSTHGVFEPTIRKVCEIVHETGAQVYLDGANLNAQVGICRPGNYGADICHINLHKTFCIPHGGGGPGVGPIAVAEHLAPFLPGHPKLQYSAPQAIGAVSGAPLGSASILPVSWMYLRMMGADSLRNASAIALLNANYLAQRLNPYFPVLFRGPGGYVAHECILDLRPLRRSAGLEVDDIAKRLMDYGFHAPTVSWPVAGTMMLEPTESETLEELDRFCTAMIAIRSEATNIELGISDRKNNPLRQAPHTMRAVSAEIWDRPYSRRMAAFPIDSQLEDKVWPATARIDNAFGDRNLSCTCPSVESLTTVL
ncbi:glycine dehydrogenase (aminomethyl-transferring) [cyanobiont of Ornithocercus magnificus]|nr:glycine dehydrogenase (aminomethyl-transferring) [cyanobiont of Ornithocercus magnificus]